MNTDAECPDIPDVKQPGGNKVPFFKDWKFWTAVGTILVSLFAAVDKHFEAKAERAARAQAEADAQSARQAAQSVQERLALLEAEQDSMRRFLINYEIHVREIRNALSRFEETGTEKAEADIWASVAAFVNFVEKWRRVQPILKELLNGNVNKLVTAAEAKDSASTAQLNAQLEKNLPDQRLVLEKEIENLKAKK